MHIGLYFGSFNPIHIAHLIIASYTKHTTDIQQIWFVITPHNPHKNRTSLLNEYDRLHLVQIAIQNDPFLRASDIEFNLPKPSYTCYTLTTLREKYPQHTFSIIMGADSFSNLAHWKNYKSIVESHKIYIYNRNNIEIINTIQADIELLNAPLLDISSSKIREMIQLKIPIRYLVPDVVADEIEKSGYYR